MSNFKFIPNIKNIFDWKKDTWSIVEKYLLKEDGTHLVHHQLHSYNEFIKKYLPEIIYAYNPLHLKYEYMENHNNYQYEIFITFQNVSMTAAMIHENDGSMKLMFPNDARKRNFTYASDLFIDLHIRYLERDPTTGKICLDTPQKIDRVSLGKIPIMLQSCLCILNKKNIHKTEECIYDKGGYFIINGSEKVIVSQERRAENRIFVCKNNKAQHKYSLIAEINSMISGKVVIPKTVQIKMMSKNIQGKGKLIKISISHIRQELPLFIIFKALGIVSDYEILQHILLETNISNKDVINYEQFLRPSIEETVLIKTQIDALEYMSKYVTTYNSYNKNNINFDKKNLVKDILIKDFLPHMGQTEKDLKKKALFMGYMVKNMLDVQFGKRAYDDRDSYINKRINTPGILMANLFRQYFTKVVKDMKSQINKEFNTGSWRASNNFPDLINVSNIYKIVKFNIIATGLKYALATGNWGLKNMANKQGIAQVLSRLTYNSTLSHLRRINTPIEKNGKLVGPRKLHSTQMMIMCPAETPEGSSIGVVKNISLSCIISSNCNPYPVLNLIKEFGLVDIDDIYPGKQDYNLLTKIIVNGTWVGITNIPDKLHKFLITKRRRGIINIYISISWDITQNKIEVNTEAGRCIRPLYILENNKFKITGEIANRLRNNLLSWNDLLIGGLYTINPNMNVNSINPLNEGVIEFIDVQEADTSMIAMDISKLSNLKNKIVRYKYTHCELHPSMMLGVLGSVIPFAEHNQAPRNLFQSAMGKQAMGVYVTNFKERTDIVSHILHYPQRPIVDSKIMQFLPSHSLPCGVNAIIAVASYSGYNQEDSLIINQDAIDRGLFVSTHYRTYKVEEKKSQASGEDERFCKPCRKSTKGMKIGNYEKLNDNGFVEENVKINENDIIIGKVMRTKFRHPNGDVIYKDNSQIIKPNETGFVEKVIVSRNGEGYRFSKVKIRSVRNPVIGDKHSSRHGQKGTIGMSFPAQDMPFSDNGIIPDMIMNPHAVPSRMTIGQLKESILGKICCTMGKYGDATPFTNLSVEELEEVLETECNMHKHGYEVLYNGTTGEQLKVAIFIGPTFYQRLKHMVNDKMHSRGTGPMVTLTRQPAEGRSRDGGLRLGEMEKDCMLAYGASSFLKEILLDKSDNFKMYICKQCGMTAIVNNERKIYGCNNCKNYSDYSEIRIPYACKLFLQELQCMSIGPRLISEKVFQEKSVPGIKYDINNI